MTKTEKQIADLERRIKALEVEPKEQHIHYHTQPAIGIPDWTWRPQPYYPPYYPYRWTSGYAQIGGTICNNDNVTYTTTTTNGQATS